MLPHHTAARLALMCAHAAEKTFNDETRLLLYALGAQVTRGPVSAADKPWAWNVVESAMWEARSQLGSMPAMEAMRLYVRTLDEDQPGWWLRMPPGVAGGRAPGGRTGPPGRRSPPGRTPGRSTGPSRFAGHRDSVRAVRDR